MTIVDSKVFADKERLELSNKIWRDWLLSLYEVDIVNDPMLATIFGNLQNIYRSSYGYDKFEDFLKKHNLEIREDSLKQRYITSDNEGNLTVFLLKRPWENGRS